MRLNEESIKYILDLQKSMLPLIYCCANNERLRTLEASINHYNGRLSYKNSEQYEELDSINTLLIFLDEINSLDLSIQAKLLKVIEEKKFRRLGGEKEVAADFRIIAATNEAIRKAIDTMEQKMGNVTSGLNLPAGFGF